MKIKKVRARNFLSIGKDWLEIDFQNLSNIVLIKGLNLDVSPQSSNGAGKSTLIEMLVYGFYGKLIKDLNHKDALNKKTKDKLEIELFFEIEDTNYKIVRTRSGKTGSQGTLEFYDLDKKDTKKPDEPLNLTVGGMPDTQKAIEEKIKLNCESFVNVVCFGEHNNHAFLSLKIENKRIIVENLLALEKYVKYCKRAREQYNGLEAEIKVSNRKYDNLLESKKGVEERIGQLKLKRLQWKSLREAEIASLNEAITKKQQELTESDDGEALLIYKNAQAKISASKDEVVKLEEKRSNLSRVLEDDVQPKYDKLLERKHDCTTQCKDAKHQLDVFQNELKVITEQNKKLENLQDGVKCSACYGKVDKANYATLMLHNNNRIEKLHEDINKQFVLFGQSEEKLNDTVSKIGILQDSKRAAEEKLQQITKKAASLVEEIAKLSKIKEPSSGAKEILLGEQLRQLETKLESKKQELANADPYEEILVSTNKELETTDSSIDVCKAEIKKNQELLPYLEYWVEGFGDKDGIRSFIIDGILPALNARINYWLQFLIDNKLQLKFDRNFEPTIERNPPDGDPFVYSATSGGERRRINLAISQAFAHVTMLSTNVSPSLISLDEVALNVDLQGVQGIFKMINELSRDRQVLVTTHDVHLLDLLENCDCDIINVVKKGGFTRLNSAA